MPNIAHFEQVKRSVSIVREVVQFGEALYLVRKWAGSAISAYPFSVRTTRGMSDVLTT